MASPSANPVRPFRIRDVFRRGGLLAQWHPRFEFRPGQLAMAQEVETALAERRHLIVEAGTGTGKTLAYLVPVIASGKRVIVSTGTKALQEQLYFKDVPFLEKHLGRELRVAYMKGRANYLCLHKLYEAEKRPVLAGLEEIEDFSLIKAWETKTETGDRAELEALPQDSAAWHKVDARRELCSGSKCDQFERCFVTLMHQRAAEADIIIVNHHLFFADLALREDDFASIIPDYQAVVFDEAHEIEEVAGQHFGVQLSNYRFDELVRDARQLAHRYDLSSKGLDHSLERLSIEATAFFALFDELEGRRAFRERPVFLRRHEGEYAGLLASLERFANELKLVRGATDETLPLERRASELDQQLRAADRSRGRALRVLARAARARRLPSSDADRCRRDPP